MKRIIILVIAAAMLCTLFVACKGKNEEEKESITVKLTIQNGDEILYGPENVVIESPATVIDVVSQFINESEETIDYETQQRQLAGKTSVKIKSIDDAVEGDDEFWQVKVDKKTASFDAQVEDGAEIVVFLDKNADAPVTEPAATTAPEIQTAHDDFDD